MARTTLKFSDLLAVFPREDKKLEPSEFFNETADGSHPLLPPLAEFLTNDDSETADAFADLVPNCQLEAQTIYSWVVYLMMTYGKGMKPCLLHPQFWESMSIETEVASNWTFGNRHNFDILIIPILKSAHWTLAIWRAGIITYYDSLSFHLSQSTAQQVVEIAKTARKGIKVSDCQIVNCCRQMDVINCGVFVLISVEQMLRTGEVWEEKRIADFRFKNRHINHARLRMRRILCPTRPDFRFPRRNRHRGSKRALKSRCRNGGIMNTVSSYIGDKCRFPDFEALFSHITNRIPMLDTVFSVFF